MDAETKFKEALERILKVEAQFKRLAVDAPHATKELALTGLSHCLRIAKTALKEVDGERRKRDSQ
jgi:hypothetical protein